MNDIISQILTDLNFIKKAVGRIEEGLSILESNGQLSVEVDKKFEEFSDIENNAADVSVFNNLDCIWRSVLDIVKKELTEISYKTWLEIIVPLSIDQNKIRLGVPGEFEKGIIGCRYTPLLKTALRNIAKTDYEIEFSILRENKEKATSNGETVIEVDEIRSSINSKYTFNSFVVGKNNKWAYKYTYEIAKNPYSQHKLLYIYGETGMGKTHLIQAAGNYILKHYPAVKLLYMSIEDFTRDMIDAIRYDNSQIFKQRILGYDVLLVDDLQFIAGKEFTQAEFFKTVSEFIDKGKQVIIASSRPPEEIKLMNERLTSMFELGGVFDIQVPDMDTRLEILKRRRIEDKIELSDEELVAVAEKTHGNVREMLNAYTRYVIYNQLVQEKAK